MQVTCISQVQGLEVVRDQSRFQVVLMGSSLSLLSPTSCPFFLLDCLPCCLQAQHHTQKQKPYINYLTNFHNCIRSNSDSKSYIISSGTVSLIKSCYIITRLESLRILPVNKTSKCIINEESAGLCNLHP